MNKQVCTSGKMIKNYIIDYIVWGVFVAVFIVVLQMVCNSVIQIFGLGSLLLIGITMLLNIFGNFLVIFLTLKTLLKKNIILNSEVKKFFNKLIIFYAILMVLYIVYNFLGYTNFLASTLTLLLDVLILIFQFFYTKYKIIKEVSKSSIPYSFNQKMEVNSNNLNNNNFVSEEFVNNEENVVVNDINIKQGFDNENNVNDKLGIDIHSIDNTKAIEEIRNIKGLEKEKSAKTKICPMCGKEISVNNIFCNKCGYVYEKKKSN